MEASSSYKILRRVEGSIDCYNDVIIYPATTTEAKHNFVFFGGDIQDYPEEMMKNPTCRNYCKYNLIGTGQMLHDRLGQSCNLFVIRADHFHLKCFAK